MAKSFFSHVILNEKYVNESLLCVACILKFCSKCDRGKSVWAVTQLPVFSLRDTVKETWCFMVSVHQGETGLSYAMKVEVEQNMENPENPALC